MLILRLLTRRIGTLSSEMRSQIQSLPIPQLEALGDILLDLTDLVELQQWLAVNTTDA